ncbi:MULTISPECIES: fumarylacetoacetate hydrolase family protein [unclassified Paenibacillus]|uniref:fumarylacetoacetate hydrolase family protein n=1 Tax=unclassified Paenibacillus TaxID=185978 RepID=UPI0009547B7E|nr:MULTISPECIES: fumarylacetoacetate hydrolase family protein [unclassified Paenibacillus]ASS66813.1 fumarylacetoacetate hydrolase family protein [Paenibacillus sp. RUD330]SIP94606.1 2-keto-4-pentenoate hydratase/2-oxohepta-3-ene-1,7-dioic acid hydratase (catechol pathway) [Paenibacillus sp. RU4X]SIQ13042.1 2-keto-4-pentenoate hydratase/2-oxohepta-3-ene-1,7-dioic acid hydratase (catechol pathway) [Paenibacillus sp. RU4T]
MKLLNFIKDGAYALGVKGRRGVLDIAEAERALLPQEEARAPRHMQQVLAGGQGAVGVLGSLLERAEALESAACWLDEDSLQLGPCVPEPGKIICVGLNYRKHAEETNAAIPLYPILFNKFNNAVAAHGEDIPLPRVSAEVDYEAELVIVIGSRAKDVGEDEALASVFGYCAANDLSARDLQMRTAQWLLGKTCDKFAPIGPYLVTADEVGDPNGLGISTRVNGETRQSSNTSDMIFSCAEIVSYISRHMTLEPGDIILTGTPEGVVLGLPPERRVYLQPGDVVEIEIEKLGVLRNRMVAE